MDFTTNNSLKQHASIMHRHTNEFGDNICEEISNELKQIVDREILLEQIPHPLLGIKVIYSQKHIVDGSITNLVLTEVDKKDLIDNNSKFKVDYATGKIIFHHSLEGKYINIKYWGIGYNLLHASRIYTKLDEHGNIVETLDKLIEIIHKLGNTEYIVDILKDIENAKTSIVNGIDYSELNQRLNAIEEKLKGISEDNLIVRDMVSQISSSIEEIRNIAEDVDYRMSVLENNYLNPNIISNSEIDEIIEGLL